MPDVAVAARCSDVAVVVCSLCATEEEPDQNNQISYSSLYRFISESANLTNCWNVWTIFLHKIVVFQQFLDPATFEFVIC